MIDAVLFDWGHTLYDFVFDEELLVAGWDAGLDALGHDAPPDHEQAAQRFREEYLPRIFAPDTIEEVEYPALIAEILGEFGVQAGDDDVMRFIEAEHAAWAPARRMGDSTHALLDSLRSRGLKLGLVSNAFDPPPILHRDLEAMGLAERLDAVVFSSEVGRRKPDPLIFETALERLDVDPARALFVGDRRYEDVRGASELGMKTVLALWFRADDDHRGAEPDFEAFTTMDVLNAVRRLLGET